jgi:cyanate permease
VWQLGSVLVPAAVGPVFQATGSFYAAFVLLAVGPLLGAVALIGARDDRPHEANQDQAEPSSALLDRDQGGR